MAAEASGPRIAVTGAAGFVGRALLRHLAGHGCKAIPITRRVQGLPDAGEPLARYDDAAELARRLHRCDALIHLAAVAHESAAGRAGRTDATFAPNVAAARAAALACVQAGVPRLVLVSSIGVNGMRTQGRPFTEADAPQPQEPYAVSKLACERAAADIAAGGALELVIVRPPLVHGPHAPGNFGALWRAVAARRPLPLAGIDNQRSLIGSDNLADVLRLCAVAPSAAGQTFLVADGQDVSTPGLVRRIAHAQGREPRLWNVPLPLLRIAGSLVGRGPAVDRLGWSLQVDASHARTVLGWAPPFTLDEGLQRAARAERGETPA